MASELEEFLGRDEPADALLAGAPALIGAALGCQRVCLFLRNPVTLMSRMTHAWVCEPRHRIAREDHGWQPQSPTLAEDDPMFAEALRNPEALYIEDVESADPALVNAAYEIEHFGHRALIHAPLFHEARMWGILEPCVFDGPRRWRKQDRAYTAMAQAMLAPVAARYVLEVCP